MASGEVPAHSGPAPASDARPPAELRRGVVGFGGMLFQSNTFMAPAIATAFAIPIGMAFGGGGDGPGGYPRPYRLAVCGELDRPAGPAHAIGRVLLHLCQQRHPSRAGVP